MEKCSKSFTAIIPYFYPMKRFDKAVMKALDRGVDVTLITAFKRDIPIYSSFRNTYLFRKIIKKGGKVYEIKDKYLHMKLYSCDEQMFSIGSFNQDY